MSIHNQRIHPATPDAVRARQALLAVQHFSELSDKALDALVRRMTPRHVGAGQVIYLEGEPGEKIYILETGWTKAIRTATDGREQATAFRYGGDLFGDEAVFTDTAYPVSVIALEDVEIWAIQRQALLDVIQSYPTLATVFIQRLSERVLDCIELVEDLGLRSVQARVANTLLKHAQLVDGNLVVPRRSWATLDEMAIRLGTVRDVLSRTMKTLETEGILKVERSKIVILDARKLLKRGRV